MMAERKITVLPLSPPTRQINPENKKKLRVAAYCRVSSTSFDQLSSYQVQVRNYDHYIRSRSDYVLAGIFADEGIPGTDLKKRTSFNQMMQRAREGQIDMIITKSLSRFGRNTLDCLKCIRELRQLNVDVYFEKENINTGHSEGELLLTLISAVAQNESLNLSENVKWGIHRKYERGCVRSIPSGKFLGYKKDEHGNLIIQEAQAQTVRRIYQAFLNGQGTFQIAMMLTREKVPMAYGGKEWCASQIHKVLTNEKFQGDTRFQKTFNTDYLTKYRAKNTGQLPQPYFIDTHPAIVDRETWELVQLEFARQRQFVEIHGMNKYHMHCDEYPLSGKIFCQICGQTVLMRQSFRKRDYGQKYWICRNHRMGRYGPVGSEVCHNGHRIPAETVMRAMVESWNQLISEKETKIASVDQIDDLLTAYRIKDLKQQILEYGQLSSIPYALLIRVLDHIEVGTDGKLSVIFLAGVQVDL